MLPCNRDVSNGSMRAREMFWTGLDISPPLFPALFSISLLFQHRFAVYRRLHMPCNQMHRPTSNRNLYTIFYPSLYILTKVSPIGHDPPIGSAPALMKSLSLRPFPYVNVRSGDRCPNPCNMNTASGLICSVTFAFILPLLSSFSTQTYSPSMIPKSIAVSVFIQSSFSEQISFRYALSKVAGFAWVCTAICPCSSLNMPLGASFGGTNVGNESSYQRNHPAGRELYYCYTFRAIVPFYLIQLPCNVIQRFIPGCTLPSLPHLSLQFV